MTETLEFAKMRPRRQASSASNAPVQRTRSAGTSRATAIPEAESRTQPEPNASSTERLASRMRSNLKISKDQARETATRPLAIRAPTRSRTKMAGKDVEAEAEALADIVERKLTIREAEVPKLKSRDELCVEAMREINTASTKLSGIVETGWKTPIGKLTATGSGKSVKTSPSDVDRMALQVEIHAKSIRNGLAMLRENKPGDRDIERAACSAAGKLIALEAYHFVIPILQDMAPSMDTYYHQTTPTPSKPRDNELDIICLPLPESPISSDDEVLLNLLTSYLMYTHIATSWSVFSRLNSPDSVASFADALRHFSHLLHTSSTLLQWTSYLRNVSTKYLDSALMRVYTVITKSSSQSSSPDHLLDEAKNVYRVRLYGLLLLTRTSPGSLKPNTFWDQCVKFTMAYVKSVLASKQSSSSVKDDAAHDVLESFNTILRYVEKRSDRDEKENWTKGEGFVVFCEYWLDFAKRADNVETVKKVSRLIKLAASSGRTPSSSTVDHGPDTVISPRKTSALQASDICATLIQTTALLENALSDTDDNVMNDTIKAVAKTEAFLPLAFRRCDDDTLQKAAQKVRRAFERLRRAGLKAYETLSSSSPKAQRDGLGTLNRRVVDVLSSTLTSIETGHGEILTSALDSLFTLAKFTLNPSKPHSIDPSFEFLSQALTLVTAMPESYLQSSDKANFLRCISGTFHNLGVTLYQAGHHSHAVRFFNKSCPVSEDALRMYRASIGDVVEEGAEKSEKESQWSTLEEQLYRRWEILGVCHSKTGDRKAAFIAFRNCIKSFPFHSAAFCDRAESCTSAALWGESTSIKHIAGIVDRITYTGICDLFLPVEEVSLRGELTHSVHTKDKHTLASIVGALLERQVDGLESSKWKPAVHNMMGKLLKDALKVYSSQKMPIRRARVMLKCLQLEHSTNGKAASIVDDLEEFVIEADELLRTRDLGLDASLAGFRSQYRAALKLQLAHLVHHRMQQLPTSRVVAYVDDACGILKGILTPLPRQSLAVPPSPIAKKTQTARKTGKRQAATTRAPASRTRGRTAKVASTHPMTPKARKSSSNMLPPLPPPSFGAPMALEYAPELLELLHSSAHLLGLLGSIVKKVQVLVIGRRMSEQHVQSRPNDYVRFSIELAHEYVNLGKTNKAANIYNHTWNVMSTLDVSNETRVLFLLRYSESLIAMGSVLKGSASYTEAYGIDQTIDNDDKTLPSVQRYLTRASLLERAAVAATTFSSVQYARDDPVASINGLLQSLRLWNRAFDTLSRLAPPSSKPSEDDNPFLETQPKASSPNNEISFRLLPGLDGLGWRIAEGLLNTLFSLTRAYISRGSPREAEFFAQQAKDLATSLNMPAMVSRAYSRLGEIYLHLGQLDDSHACLAEAAKLVSDAGGPDAAEIRRLRAEHSRVNENKKDAQQLYDEAMTLLEELEEQFTVIDGHAISPRKSTVLSSKAATTSSNDTLAPSLLLSILRQNIVMLHAEGGEYQELLDRLHSLPPTAEIKAEESAIMAKLKLEDVYSRFQADMFLSSLAESAITLPMGMKKHKHSISAGTQEILAILNHAEKLFWSDLALVAKRGNVFHVRDAAISLALIKAFQDTLGKIGADGPTLAACLLDKSTAITLRREVLEVVQYKFGDLDGYDDLQWPLITPSGTPMLPPKSRKRTRFVSLDPDDDEDFDDPERATLRKYWQSLTTKYQEQPFDSVNLSNPQDMALPHHWTVISISVTEDKNTMFVTRQRSNKEPLIFYIPLKERRDSEDEEYLSFDDALAELRDIIRLSDEGTRQASSVKDRASRAAWWANRSALDKRMKQLLENIEFCWLGAFKTILSSPKHISSNALNDLRSRLETVFNRSIVVRDKKQALSVQLDDAILECFACLSPKARDEELEDLVYFILDLYQFHGIPIAIAEVDVDQVVIDFRSALEEHRAKYGNRILPQEDSHMFLVLDKNVQGIPWESIPILRGQSVSRIPSMDFLMDRLHYARSMQGESQIPVDRLVVNPRKAFFVLNPSGDLKNTEGRFVDWLKEMKEVGWTGIIGKVPSELEFADALTKKDLLIYFGHGGAEQYIRSRKVRHLPRCAATMLWGCSSGELKEMGDFDRAGTPYNYMLAGCPTLVANLWDVTDRDIDKFSQSVFDKMHLTPDAVDAWQSHADPNPDTTSIVTAVAQSRDVCKLKYLTGAAPIVYGIPFYL